MASDIVTRELACVLSETEVRLLGERLAQRELDIDKQKERRSKISRKVNELRKEVFDLATTIERGEEVREVRCEWRDDFAQNVKRLIRIDTGDEVEQVTMTAADLQLAIETPGASGQRDTIDLDDVPDDDDDLDDEDDDGGDVPGTDVPEPARAPRKPRGRSRQTQPSA